MRFQFVLGTEKIDKINQSDSLHGINDVQFKSINTASGLNFVRDIHEFASEEITAATDGNAANPPTNHINKYNCTSSATNVGGDRKAFSYELVSYSPLTPSGPQVIPLGAVPAKCMSGDVVREIVQTSGSAVPVSQKFVLDYDVTRVPVLVGTIADSSFPSNDEWTTFQWQGTGSVTGITKLQAVFPAASNINIVG